MGSAELATSFAEYFFQQGFHLDLAFLVVPALVYLGTVALVCTVFRGRIEPRTLQATFAAAFVSILLAIGGITLFEAAASWYRPSGAGASVRTPVFLERAEIAFVALYTGILVASAAIGWAFGRFRAHREPLVLLAVTIAVVGFLTASLPLVEFLNACHVGAPILADRYVAC
jgi:hypothetical protein